MAQARFYSSVAAKTTSVGTINASVTTLVVAAATGFPASLPFTLILERDTANEEVVTVTAVSGTTLTISRAQDGTTGVTHTTGAVVEHGVSARDFSEPQAHIAATTGVHGLTGAPVGTTDAQTLANKTLNSPVLTGVVSGSASWASTGASGAFVPTFNNFTLGNGAVTAYQKQIGQLQVVTVQITLGSTSAFTAGQFQITNVPTVGNALNVSCSCNAESSVGIQVGPYSATASAASVTAGVTSGTRAWGAGDLFMVTMLYLLV